MAGVQIPPGFKTLAFVLWPRPEGRVFDLFGGFIVQQKPSRSIYEREKQHGGRSGDMDLTDRSIFEQLEL